MPPWHFLAARLTVRHNAGPARSDQLRNGTIASENNLNRWMAGILATHLSIGRRSMLTVRTTRLLMLCIAIALVLSNAAAGEFEIRDGDTVAFLGDSITAARTYGKLIENYTLLRFPERKVRFINIGRGGETAAGGLERLDRDVFSQNVTLLIVAYGINDIGWGMKADDEHRQTYLDSIRGIVSACRKRGVRVFICSAAVTGADPFTSDDGFFQKMCDEGMRIAKENGGGAIDVQRSMREIQKRVWKANEQADAKEKVSLHAADTVHLNDFGQLAMAYAILKGLGAPTDVSSATLDAGQGTVLAADGCTISNVAKIDGRLEFTRLDRGLPFNNGIFSSLNYRFVPIPDELNRYLLKVKNLEAGKYKLVVSGRDVGTYSREQLGQGINISSATADSWRPGGPWDAQADLLRLVADARQNIDITVGLASERMNESDAVQEVTQRIKHVGDELLQSQRLIAKPRPYRFVLTRLDSQVDNSAKKTAPSKPQEEGQQHAQPQVRKPAIDSATAALADDHPPPISIVSPDTFQVFQRQRRTSGRVIVSGRITVEGDQVQVRFQGTPLEGKLPDGWQAMNFASASSEFNQALDLPAGGWYAVDVRVLKNGQTVAENRVEKFGIGEVFVGAGQSNSTNCGQFQTKQTSGMVSSFSGEHWQVADDPQPGVADHSKGGSFWPAFGDAMHARYKVPIGIATTGYGGTSVDQWQPDGGLFKWTLTRVHQLGPMGFRCLLWHQGETDVEMSSDDYYAKLRKVITASRQQAGWEVPWFVAQVSYHNPDKPAHESTRSAQARLWVDKIAIEGPDTDTLTGDHRDFDGTGVHFSPKGLKAHGEMWAEKVSPFIDEMLQE